MPKRGVPVSGSWPKAGPSFFSHRGTPLQGPGWPSMTWAVSMEPMPVRIRQALFQLVLHALSLALSLFVLPSLARRLGPAAKAAPVSTATAQRERALPPTPFSPFPDPSIPPGSPSSMDCSSSSSVLVGGLAQLNYIPTCLPAWARKGVRTKREICRSIPYAPVKLVTWPADLRVGLPTPPFGWPSNGAVGGGRRAGHDVRTDARKGGLARYDIIIPTCRKRQASQQAQQASEARLGWSHGNDLFQRNFPMFTSLFEPFAHVLSLPPPPHHRQCPCFRCSKILLGLGRSPTREDSHLAHRGRNLGPALLNPVTPCHLTPSPVRWTGNGCGRRRDIRARRGRVKRVSPLPWHNVAGPPLPS